MTVSRPRICVPVCAPDLATLEPLGRKAAEAADIVELRLDCLENFRLDQLPEILDLVRGLQREVIITFRSPEQGGHNNSTFSERQEFWRTAVPIFKNELLDIEFDLINQLDLSSVDWQRIICSHHDFKSVPGNLYSLYEEMARTPARVLKIAVAAHDAVDCIPVFKLLSRANATRREMIAIAMGAAGVATRILGPSRGSFLAYAALDTENETAPGQCTAPELRNLYRIDHLTQNTQLIGIVGSPVSHSLSPLVHNHSFATANVDAVYLRFEVKDLHAFIKRMAHPRTRELNWNLRGLSITAPHKSAVMPLLDEIDAAAKEVGAVNTVVIEGDRLIGYNTDAVAALKPAMARLGSLKKARCAVIGAGGAARAVLWSLRNEGADVTVFARNIKQGAALAREFNFRSAELSNAGFGEFELVINATPLGTAGSLEQETAVTGAQLSGAGLAYDLVYNPSETRFMKEARGVGCDTVGGLNMLVLQAAEQFKLWTGLEAPLATMRETVGLSS